ncbi:MAG: DegT/DnrJ/EryC1/StrS aminotransferase family protein [Sterolibacterium sp.]|nr:DegT/DnrJ/EryC1/StrS aminotransferase family protein [Sterolibacterium sp.]
MIQVFRAVLSEEAIAEASQCMREGWVGYGPRCHRLEQHFVDQQGGWALATGTCTSALYLSALLLEPAPGDEVIVPATTFVSTAMAFHWAGWQVRVADVDPETLLLMPENVEAVATDRTRAVVAVHLYGQRAAVHELNAFCTSLGYTLIEDGAHRLPLSGEAAPAGQFACYSFNAVKEAPAGEGGLLWCADATREADARQISNLGLSFDTLQRCSTLPHRDYEFSAYGGLKLRLNDIAGTLALHGVNRLVETRQQRQALARRYDQAFRDLSPCLQLMHRQSDDSGLMYVVRIEKGRRSALRAALAGAGIASSVHYSSLSQHPFFSGTSCPNAEQAQQEVLTLPLRLNLTAAEQDKIIEVVRHWAAAEDEAEVRRGA